MMYITIYSTAFIIKKKNKNLINIITLILFFNHILYFFLNKMYGIDNKN